MHSGVDVITDGEQRRDNYASFVGDLFDNYQLIPIMDLLPYKVRQFWQTAAMQDFAEVGVRRGRHLNSVHSRTEERRRFAVADPQLYPLVQRWPGVASVITVEVPNPGHPLGIRGVGEVPIAPPAAIANAIYRAVGVRILELPMSPPKVAKALWEKEGKDL